MINIVDESSVWVRTVNSHYQLSNLRISKNVNRLKINFKTKIMTLHNSAQMTHCLYNEHKCRSEWRSFPRTHRCAITCDWCGIKRLKSFPSHVAYRSDHQAKLQHCACLPRNLRYCQITLQITSTLQLWCSWHFMQLAFSVFFCVGRGLTSFAASNPTWKWSIINSKADRFYLNCSAQVNTSFIRRYCVTLIKVRARRL